MSVLVKNLSVVLLAAGAFAAVGAQAQDMPMRGPIPFDAFDKDGNKMISPQEFVDVHNQRKKMGGRVSGEQAFTFFDANGDSQISPEELEAGRSKMRQKRGAMGRGQAHGQGRGPGMGPGAGQGPGQSAGPGPGSGRGMESRPGPGPGMGRGREMPKFADFDLNADGNLTENEFYQAREQRMQQRSEQGYPMRRAGSAPPFGAMDANRDGNVTEQEFTGFLSRYQGRSR